MMRWTILSREYDEVYIEKRSSKDSLKLPRGHRTTPQTFHHDANVQSFEMEAFTEIVMIDRLSMDPSLCKAARVLSAWSIS
jgi:hypothetical protein